MLCGAVVDVIDVGRDPTIVFAIFGSLQYILAFCADVAFNNEHCIGLRLRATPNCAADISWGNCHFMSFHRFHSASRVHRFVPKTMLRSLRVSSKKLWTACISVVSSKSLPYHVLHSNNTSMRNSFVVVGTRWTSIKPETFCHVFRHRAQFLATASGETIICVSRPGHRGSPSLEIDQVAHQLLVLLRRNSAFDLAVIIEPIYLQKRFQYTSFVPDSRGCAPRRNTSLEHCIRRSQMRTAGNASSPHPKTLARAKSTTSVRSRGGEDKTPRRVVVACLRCRNRYVQHLIHSRTQAC